MMKTSVWILGDQLLEQQPALLSAESESGRENIRVLLIESESLMNRLPYQRKKLVLLISAMRHYAARLQSEGYTVEVLSAPDMLTGLQRHVVEAHPEGIYCMAASHYQGRVFQNKLQARLGVPVQILPNTQFLSGRQEPLPDARPDQRVVMETFYRQMRKHFHLLMDTDGSPVGGRWNYDAENRRPLQPGIDLPERRRFEPDQITTGVMEEVSRLERGVGSVKGFDLAVTHSDAREALVDFLDHRLKYFGPYEDAMSTRSDLLFHSLLSPYLNIGLLEPLDAARAAEARFHSGRSPLPSVEGFVRQVVGWREYIYWQYWRQMPGLLDANFWGAQRPLPVFFWDGETDMNCLHQVILRALQSGYTHHIERLMLVCNYCLLAGIAPLEVNAWFTACYVDAYEWVMLPNVLGMGLFADGGMTATKPYIASANYINKMSDYCASCRYQPKKRLGEDACPFNLLYWNFLIENEDILRKNPRMGPNVLGLRWISNEERQAIRQQSVEYMKSCQNRSLTKKAW